MKSLQNYWLVIALIVLLLTALTGCDPITGVPSEEPVPTKPVGTAPPDDDIRERVAAILEGDVIEFEVVEIDLTTIAESLEAGKPILLPLASPENEIVELELPSTRVQLRAEGLTEGILRTEEGEVRTVELPPEQNFQIGTCAENREEFNSCGSLTILDQEKTMIGGILVHEDLGFTFFEPVDSLLGGRDNPGVHIIYNIVNTVPVEFGENESPQGKDTGFNSGGSHGLAALPPAATFDFIYRDTSIVLDGDVKFYEVDKSTVWSRQEEAYNAVSIVYGIIEPLSAESPNTDTWGLDLKIKGQEVWVSGGPTQTNGNDLIAYITDPNYFLLNPVTDKELHYLFVGYSVSGLYGQAAGIGTTAGFGGGAGMNHAFGDGRGTASLKTRWVVMAHEVGHLLGGQHPDGINDCTTFFFFWQICGKSIMLGGEAGGPETRAPFFSDANDVNIANVLKNVLP